MVSGDHGGEYVEAMTTIAPHTVRDADRFRLLKDLGDVIPRVFGPTVREPAWNTSHGDVGFRIGELRSGIAQASVRLQRPHQCLYYLRIELGSCVAL